MRTETRAAAARAPRLAAFVLPTILLVATSCTPATPPRTATRTEAQPRWFDYVALDGTRLGTETTRGRVTIIALITTYDLGSQVVVREMADLFSRHRPRINAGVVVMEPPKSAPLAEAFASTLELPFPVALADAATLEGRGPFGEISITPTTIVLDPSGAEVFRRAGVVSTADLSRALSDALR